MPKADTEHTTARDTTTLPPAAIPPLDRIHRGIWADLWKERSPENRLECICSDASRRLHGLGDILLSLGMSATTSKHETNKFHFLAETAFDIADALAAAHDAVRLADDAAELVEEEARDREAKAAKRRRKALKRRASA
jgi:hypothetical protein